MCSRTLGNWYYLLLGQVFRDGQKWSEAISVYRRGLKQIPGNQELQTGLKETYSQQNQQQKIEENIVDFN